ncbi:MAG TPA: Holliday junction branch migration protein RuvA, partial [Methylophilus sp.]
MIARLNGRLLEKSPPLIVIDCNGVGYEVEVPMSTFYNLPEPGQPVQLLTYMVVREDAQLLYGFGSEQEKNTFKQL